MYFLLFLNLSLKLKHKIMIIKCNLNIRNLIRERKRILRSIFASIFIYILFLLLIRSGVSFAYIFTNIMFYKKEKVNYVENVSLKWQ